MKLFADIMGVQYYQGDSRWMDLIPDDSVHLVATSSPYYNAKPYSVWTSWETYYQDMLSVMKECHRVLVDGGRIAWNIPNGYGRPGDKGKGGRASNNEYEPLEARMTLLFLEAGFRLRGHIIWNKGDVSKTSWGTWMKADNPIFFDIHEMIVIAQKGSSSRSGGVSTISKEEFLECTKSVWRINAVPGQKRDRYVAPWPERIPYLLTQFYTFEGDVVLDPFAGSFTTCHVAAGLKRGAIGIELHKKVIEHYAGPLFTFDDGGS